MKFITPIRNGNGRPENDSLRDPIIYGLEFKFFNGKETSKERVGDSLQTTKLSQPSRLRVMMNDGVSSHCKGVNCPVIRVTGCFGLAHSSFFDEYASHRLSPNLCNALEESFANGGFMLGESWSRKGEGSESVCDRSESNKRERLEP